MIRRVSVLLVVAVVATGVRSARFVSGALAGIAVLITLVLSSAGDAGRVQAQTNAQTCANLITSTALRADCEVLLGFKDTLQGPVAQGATAPLNWGDTGVAFAQWTGITTSGTGASKRVTGISSYNVIPSLTGSIPIELGDLDNLTLLSISRNELTGPIPPELGRLTELTTLYLNENQLSGPIPAELGDLADLTWLSLHTNQLSGSIPIELGNLTSLTDLRISINELTGPIPPELGRLTDLTTLYLNDNQLTGPIPAELGDLTDMQDLHLQNNQLTGPIPEELGNLTDLTKLILHANQLTGSIPAELGDLTDMQFLYLYGNQLSGPIPEELGNLTGLTRLLLNDNQLSGSIPAELGDLTGLQYLYLYNNQLTGEIPAELGSLPGLQHLYLQNNQLTGEIPAELGSLPGLFQLILNDNQLIGSIPSSLGDLTGLTILRLYDNQLTGSIPAELGDLTGLTQLHMHHNQLTGPIPEELGNLTGLTQLNLHHNQLSGPIPAELGDLTGLTYLNLQNNQLSGPIPSSLGDLIALRYLQLQNNQLTGSIPSSLGGLNILDALLLHANQLSGSIPIELGDLTSLTDLRISKNELTGPIPSSLGDLTGLTALYLNDNRLTGPIPPELGRLTDLRYLSMANNQLTGEVPQTWISSISLNTLRLGVSQMPDELVANIEGASIYVSLPDSALPSGASAENTSIGLNHLDEGDLYVRANRAVLPPGATLPSSPKLYRIRLFDSNNLPVSNPLSSPAVLCLPEDPKLSGDQYLFRINENGSTWEVLLPPSPLPPSYSTGYACGEIHGFSIFTVGTTTSRPVTATARILRVEPSIRSATVSVGDLLRLELDVYGVQDILDNKLEGIATAFWSDGSGGGSFDGSGRRVVYTAPMSSGVYTVTAFLSSAVCRGTEEQCTAKFEIRVRRPSVAPPPTPVPINPAGNIPSILADDQGRQYEVFTPIDGGSFDGDGISITAGPGAVPNGEVVGVRMHDAGPASNVGMTAQRYTLVGSSYDVPAVDATGAAISSYVLNAPAEVCVPLPPEARHNISDVALVVNNPDGTLTILSASVRIVESGVNVCGNLSTLPATIAVGVAGVPATLPTAAPEAEPAIPDTGGQEIPPVFAILAMLFGTGAIAIAAFILLGMSRTGSSRRR